MRLSVRSKILASLAFIVLVMVSHRLVSMYVMSAIDRRATRALAQHLEVSTLLSELSCQAQAVHNGALFYVNALGQEEMARRESQMQQAMSECRALVERLSEVCQTAPELQQIGDFHYAWNAYTRILTQQLLPADKAKAQSLLRDSGAAGIAAQEAFSRLNALAEASTVAAEDTLREIDGQRTRAQSILLVLMLGAAAISILFAMNAASGISSAINSVRNAARLVAEGDLEWSIALNTGDEIEDTAESLTKVARRTRQSLAVSRETTEQLQRQVSESRKLEALLAVERNRLGTVVDLLQQAVIVTDADGRITLLSERAAELTGWRREQALGEPADVVLHLLDETTGERRPSPADDAAHSRRMVRRSKQATLLDKEGTEHHIVLDSAPVLNGDNQIGGAVIVFYEKVPDR